MSHHLYTKSFAVWLKQQYEMILPCVHFQINSLMTLMIDTAVLGSQLFKTAVFAFYGSLFRRFGVCPASMDAAFVESFDSPGTHTSADHGIDLPALKHFQRMTVAMNMLRIFIADYLEATVLSIIDQKIWRTSKMAEYPRIQSFIAFNRNTYLH
jgi:hypothetical protein